MYLIDVLSLEFQEEVLQSFLVRFNANAVQDLFDVRLRGRSSVEGEKKVSSEMFHGW